MLSPESYFFTPYLSLHLNIQSTHVMQVVRHTLNSITYFLSFILYSLPWVSMVFRNTFGWQRPLMLNSTLSHKLFYTRTWILPNLFLPLLNSPLACLICWTWCLNNSCIFLSDSREGKKYVHLQRKIFFHVFLSIFG